MFCVCCRQVHLTDISHMKNRRSIRPRPSGKTKIGRDRIALCTRPVDNDAQWVRHGIPETVRGPEHCGIDSYLKHYAGKARWSTPFGFSFSALLDLVVFLTLLLQMLHVDSELLTANCVTILCC